MKIILSNHKSAHREFQYLLTEKSCKAEASMIGRMAKPPV